MTKRQFAELLAKKGGFSLQQAERVLNAVLDSIEDALFKDGRVELRGFGIFDRRIAAARTGRNPATGEAVAVPARAVPRFRPAASLNEALN